MGAPRSNDPTPDLEDLSLGDNPPGDRPGQDIVGSSFRHNCETVEESMPLFLIESELDRSDQSRITSTLDRIAAAAGAGTGEVIEAQVSEGFTRLFLVLDIGDAGAARHAVESGGLKVNALKTVRLIGQDLSTIKKRKGTANYLVEWNLPSGLSMEAYLRRKAEKTPLYAEVPEVSFERTYVCEDMSKCLCFYAGPDEEAVVRARQAVSAPIDSLNKIKNVR